MSVSPLKELSKSAMVDVQQTNLKTLSSSKHVSVNLGTVKHCGNNHDYYSRRPPRKNQGKQSRKSRMRKLLSGTNSKNFNQSKSSGAKYIGRLVSMWKQRTAKEEIALEKATTPNTKISCKKVSNKEIKSSSFEKFTS